MKAETTLLNILLHKVELGSFSNHEFVSGAKSN